MAAWRQDDAWVAVLKTPQFNRNDSHLEVVCGLDVLIATQGILAASPHPGPQTHAMKFGDHTLAGDWIGMSLERLRQLSGEAELCATVDSVRPDRRATSVTIVRWRASGRASASFRLNANVAPGKAAG